LRGQGCGGKENDLRLVRNFQLHVAITVKSRRFLYSTFVFALVVVAVVAWRRKAVAASSSSLASSAAAKAVLPAREQNVVSPARDVPSRPPASAFPPPRTGKPLPADQMSSILGAIASGDPLVWEPAVHQLSSLNYDRLDEIAALTELLNSPNREVRVRAAGILFELGSAAGRGVMNETLAAAARGEAVTWMAVVTSAQTLQDYRQPMDGDALWAVYQRLQAPELLEVATMQQLPQVRELVLERRRNRQLGYETEYMAAYLGMKDGESLARYQQLLSAYPKVQVLGHWALYQATGEPQHLDFVVSTLRQAIGMDPLPKDEMVQTVTKHLAFKLLQITMDERGKAALRAIADYSAQTSKKSVDFSSAFGALLYLHHDYAFVDQRIMEYLRGGYGGPHIGGFMMDLAAARATPEIEAAAKALNYTAYEYAFSLRKGRPLEAIWPNLGHIPVSVAPPLP
jgi:hypothetical protein